VTTLSESESKRRVAAYDIPVVADRLCPDAATAVDAADGFGYPVVAKLTGDAIAHKSERGLVRVGLADAAAVRESAVELLAAARPADGSVAVLVAPMVRGSRELIAGLHYDTQFGPCVMVGIGGILAEALRDVAFRLAPIDRLDVAEMIDDLAGQALLGPLRGEPPVSRDALADVLLGLSAMAEAESDVVAVDLNPLIVSDGHPIAVDALVETV
jgi:acetate---CoA ligase (ADP-forming) subunit beta